jgi:hypothetical protein
LVCRRWWAVVCSPSLLREIDVDIAACSVDFLLKLRSLSTFLLMRAAGHMTSACLSMWPAQYKRLSAVQRAEAETTLSAMLAACAAAGGLTELHLSLDTPLCVGGWAAALRGLRQLHIDVYADRVDGFEYSILLQAPLLGSKLEDLWLSGCPLTLTDSAGLPSSLTALGLLGLQGMLPPHVRGAAVCMVFDGEPAEACGGQCLSSDKAQTDACQCALRCAAAVSAFTALQAGCPRTLRPGHGTDFGVLVQLSRLGRLKAGFHQSLPISLSLLTSLKKLRLEQSVASSGPAGAALNVSAFELVLGALKQLTCLLLDCKDLAHPPAALAGPRNMRRFGWFAREAVWAAVLPSGPWLANLHRLELPAAVAANHIQQLAAATQLELLSLSGCSGIDSPAQVDILRWAGQRHTSLQLDVPLARGMLDNRAANAALEAGQRNPGLHVTFT